jgi:tRNA (guanine26-N2/guanine27-N2)-dimethyltransferase
MICRYLRIIKSNFQSGLSLSRISTSRSANPGFKRSNVIMSSSANESTSPPGLSDSSLIKITEGSATMFYDKSEQVFYNKVQVFNRDLSILVISLFSEIYGRERLDEYNKKLERYTSTANPSSKPAPWKSLEGISILDALAATGLRSIRYLKEIQGVRQVTINDLLPAATTQALKNCQLNQVDESKVNINTEDATMFMYRHRDHLTRYDVIDLDPYGSAAPFIDAAVQAVSDGGLLCVTCTDMTVLSGNYPEVCFAKYGSAPLKPSYVHEMSLRILLHALDSAANKYSRHIYPWLSISVDFYVRVFVRVFESPVEVKRSSMKRGMLHQSTQCPSFFVQPLGHISAGKRMQKSMDESTIGERSEEPVKTGGLTYSSAVVSVPSRCPETGGNMKIGGPFWTHALHDQHVVDAILERLQDAEQLPYISTATRIKGILSSVSEELKDVPFHYNLSDLASAIRIKNPTLLEMQSAIINAGYRVSQFHREPLAIKTDAPDAVVWDIMRAYAQSHPPERSKHKKFPEAATAILNKPSTLDSVSFEVPDELKGKKRVARYFPNPGTAR